MAKTNTQKDFSKFGSSFQRKLAELILRDRVFADQIEEVLDIEFFESKYLRVFAKKIFEYRQDHDVHPSVDIMTSVIRSGLDEYPDPLSRKVREYFAQIKAKGEDGKVEDEEYVKDKALDFCKKQDLRGAIYKAYKLTEEDRDEEVEGVIREALRRGQDNDVGHEFLKDFESRYKGRSRSPVSTGWDNIDEITQGGHGRGELGVCIAPAGAGKSMTLSHFGTKAVEEGLNVVHYTLELRDGTVGNRYDSCYTGVPLDLLDDKKDEVLEEIKDIPGDLIIKEYPTKSASTQTLKRHLEKVIRRGTDVDVVIVDYADLLRPVKGREMKRDELESIYENLRALAKEFEVALWTASQTNRKGLNKEVITMEEISEAFSKCFVSDFIFTLSRTIDDKNMGTGRILVAKNRNGPDGMVYPIFMDTSCVSIEVLDRDNQSVREMRDERKKEAEEDISDLFQSYKKQGG